MSEQIVTADDAPQRQIAVATAQRARREEDARGPLYTPEQEVALTVSRRKRAIRALDE